MTLFEELFSPRGRLSRAAFAWRCAFYVATVTGGALVINVAWSVAGLSLMPAWREAAIFVAVSLPFMWMLTVHCARRLRDARAGMGGLGMMLGLTLVFNIIGVWLWAISDVSQDDRILRGAALWLDALIVPVWLVYLAVLAMKPSFSLPRSREGGRSEAKTGWETPKGG